MKRILSLLICVSVILSASFFVMPVYASNEEPLIDYIYFDDFSTTGNMANYFTSYNPTVKIWDTNTGAMADAYKSNFSIDDNTLKVTNTTTGGVKRVGFRTPTPAGKPKLVFSFDVKLNFTTAGGYYFATRSGYGSATLAMYDDGRILTNSAGNSDNTGATYTKGEWVNVTLVYDNDNTKSDNRDIYVNGINYGSYTDASASWSYANKGFVEFLPQFYSKAGDSVQLDNIGVYAYPTELKYELESETSTEVKLNFNMIPDSATLIPSNFIVKDDNTIITPAKVTLSKENVRQVVLSFDEALTTGKTYTVSAQNITAGATKTDDVSETITLTPNLELSFKVPAAKVEWTATSNIWGYDYENTDTVTGITKDETKYGTFALGTGGLYNIETDGENNFLTLQQNNTAVTDGGTIVSFLPRSYNFKAGNAYAIETKVKVDFSKNPDNAMFDTMTHSGWGLCFSSLYNGVIYTDTGLTKSIGTYKDGEWVTMKNVYYSTPVMVDLTDDETDNPTEQLRRDIYINGQFVETVYDSWTDYGKTLNGTQNCRITFRVRDIDSKINTEGKAYIDYIRVYKTSDSFASKLTSATDIDTSFINVQFNSTPVLADLTSKIYIADENGTKISDIAVPEFVNEFNAQGYASKVNLWFAEELENGKTYKLCINGVTDIAGNTLYQEETFTTKAIPEAEGLALTGGIASVTVNEYSEPLTLYVVGYEMKDGVEQMTTVVTKTITATGEFSTDTPATGTVVKAFLWKGTKPVIACESN